MTTTNQVYSGIARDSRYNWEFNNPVIPYNVLCIEDEGKMKVGSKDLKKYNELSYLFLGQEEFAKIIFDLNNGKENTGAAASLVNAETLARQNADALLSDQIVGLFSGYLGAIAYNAVAPTPAKNGWYEFSTEGVVSWIAGTPSAKIGDKVSVIFTSPSTYLYIFQNVNIAGVLSAKVDKVILLSITTAPTPTAIGQKYYDSATKKIYTVITGLVWDTGVNPVIGTVYIFGNLIYNWNGTDLKELNPNKFPVTSTNNKIISDAIVDAYMSDYNPLYRYYIDVLFWINTTYGTKIRIKKELISDGTVSDYYYAQNLVGVANIINVFTVANCKIAVDGRLLTPEFGSSILKIYLDDRISDANIGNYINNLDNSGNTTAIAANTTAIAANTTAIAANTIAIAANTPAIAANTTAIAGKADKVTLLSITDAITPTLQGQYYYNSTSKKLFKSLSNLTWGSSFSPSIGTIYLFGNISYYWNGLDLKDSVPNKFPVSSTNNKVISDAIVDAYMSDYDPLYRYYIEVLFWVHATYATRIRIRKELISDNTISDYFYAQDLIAVVNTVSIYTVANCQIAIDGTMLTQGFGSSALKIYLDPLIANQNAGNYINNAKLKVDISNVGTIANIAAEKAEDAKLAVESMSFDNFISVLPQTLNQTQKSQIATNLEYVTSNKVLGVSELDIPKLNGFILESWVIGDISLLAVNGLNLYTMKNLAGASGQLIQFRDNSSTAILQYITSDASPKTGIQIIYVPKTSSTTYQNRGIMLKVNWDLLSSAITPNIAFDFTVLPNFEPTKDIKAYLHMGLAKAINNEAIYNRNLNTVGYISSDSDNTLFDSKTILAVCKSINANNAFPITGTIYTRSVKNIIGANGQLIQFYNAKTGGALIAQYLESKDTINTGITRVTVVGYNTNKTFDIVINWDTIANYSSTSFPFGVILENLPDNYDSDIFKRLNTLEAKSTSILAKNCFGDILPIPFKAKFMKMEKDIEICLVGNSLTGQIQASQAIDSESIKLLPPSNVYNHWTKLLYDKICKNKPVYYRWDSGIFTYSGTWAKMSAARFNSPDWTGNYSSDGDVVNLSTTTEATAQFIMNTDAYEKCNIIHAKFSDGDASIIAVSGGNGILLCCEDKINWVEMNGYELSHKTNPTGLTDVQCQAAGITWAERNRRLWIKRVAKNGIQTITLTKKSSTGVMYFWGVCLWNGYSQFVTPLGRGGRSVEKLSYNSSDISNRKPDFVIFEMPVANEVGAPSYSNATLIQNYNNYLTGALPFSLKTLSNNFSDFQVLVVLPHGRADYFLGNDAIDWINSGSLPNVAYPYYRGRQIYQSIKDTNVNETNIAFINLGDQLLNEAFYYGMTYQQFLTGSSSMGNTMTADGIHLNNLGSKLWACYLAGLFT